MFLTHLFKILRAYLKNEYTIYRLINRLENPDIRRPFEIINPHRLEVGKNILIQPHCFFHCGGNAWSDYRGRISIGDHCCFGEYNILYGAGEIEMGDKTDTGPGVMIFSSRDNYSREFARLPKIVHEFRKVTIGSYVIIFANALISPGVNIGDGAVIGAGSVVTRDIPPWTVAAGTPARVIKDREHDTPLPNRKQD